MKFNGSTLVIMAALMIAPAIILETSLFDSEETCSTNTIDLSTGTVDFAPFDAVSTSGAVHVVLRQGAQEGIELEGDAKDFDKLQIFTKGTTLHVGLKPRVRDMGDVVIQVTFDDLKDLKVSGACKVSLEADRLPDDFDVHVSGASKVSIASDFDALDLNVSGASKIKLSGNSTSADYRISGASHVASENMDFDDMDVLVSGAALVKLGKGNNLDVRASGAANVKYVDAKEVSRKVSGAASVSKS